MDSLDGQAVLSDGTSSEHTVGQLITQGDKLRPNCEAMQLSISSAERLLTPHALENCIIL